MKFEKHVYQDLKAYTSWIKMYVIVIERISIIDKIWVFYIFFGTIYLPFETLWIQEIKKEAYNLIMRTKEHAQWMSRQFSKLMQIRVGPMIHVTPRVVSIIGRAFIVAQG